MEPHERQLETLAAVCQLLAVRSGQRELLAAVLDVLEQRLAVRRGTILLLTPSGRELVVAAAQSVFPQAGYQLSGSNYPYSISFDKGSSRIANVMWGSYGDPQTIRVRVKINQIPGTSNYRLVPNVYSVSDAGEVGFEDQRPLMGLWSGEFGPLLKQVAAQAGGAGAM